MLKNFLIRISLLASLLSIFLLKFGHVNLATPYLGYTLLFLVYVLAVSYYVSIEPNRYETLLLLLIVSLISQVYAINPIVHGIFGVDSYKNLDVLLKFGSVSIFEYMSIHRGWPHSFIFVETIQQITGIDVEIVSKYILLISVFLPAVFYIFSVRVCESKFIAFMSAFSLVVLNNYSTSATEFRPFSFGIILYIYFTLLLAVLATSKNTNYKIVLIILAASLVLVHPMIGLLSFLTGVSILLSNKLEVFSKNRSVGRFVPKEFRSLRISAVSLIIISSLFVFLYGFLLAEHTFLQVLLGGSAASEYNVQVAREDLSLSPILMDYMYASVLVALALVHFIAFLSTYRYKSWELSIGFVCALLSFYFVVDIFMGRPLGISGARFTIFLVPLLFLSSGSILSNNKWLSKQHAQYVIMILIILLAVSQVFSFPFHILYSDPAHTVPEADGNPTVGERHAAEWGTTYMSDVFVSDATHKYVSSRILLTEDISSRCSEPFLNRYDVPEQVISNQQELDGNNIIYNSNYIKISDCER